MSLTQYIFWFLSFLALMSSLMVVFTKNAVYSVLCLIITFFAIAGHYLLLNAQFLAAVHIIVYAGAIMVLFLYVIMMLNQNKDTEPKKHPYLMVISVIASGLLMLTMVGTVKSAELPGSTIADAQVGTIEKLGQVLFTDFLLPFEVSSILFLAAMVGAVYLSKNKLQS
jgi:NADH-quinone oxidoreductase subunit J